MASRFSVEAVFKAVDNVTAPVTRMQGRVQKFTRTITKGLRNANRALGKFTKGLARGAGVAAKFGGLAIAAGITAVAVAVNKVADSADSLAKRSRRLEMPVAELQEWQFVAEQSGFTVAEFDKSVEGLTKRMGEARAGTGSLFTFLKKTDSQLLKQVVTTDNVSDAMQLMIKKLQESKDPMERAALANAAFGKQGLKMANVAELGAKKIAQLRKEQSQNGVITKFQANAAEDYNDATNSLQKSLAGLLQNVFLPMLPKITKLVRAFREWIIANKDLIKINVAKMFESIKNAIFRVVDSMKAMDNETNVFETIKNAVVGLVNLFAFLAEHGKTIAIIVGGIVALSAAMSAFTVVMAAVNLVMSLNPIGLLILGVVALGAAVALLIANWEPVKDFFADLWGDITGIFDSALERIMAVVGKVTGAVSIVTGAISSASDFLGFGDDNETESQVGATGPQIVSPQERVARTIDEQRTTSTSEVTIRDETGRAEVTGGALGSGLNLQSTGGI